MYKYIIIILLISGLFTQDCESGFTYIDIIPSNLNNIANDSKCFFDADLNVLNSVYTLNNLDEYDSYLELGAQMWISGRLITWVATYVPNGSNGINQKISILPDNFGDLTNLSALYIEKHDLTILPNSITELLNLTTLMVSNNWLTILPETLGDLTSLVTLDLGYNQIVSLPESIGQLENLEYIFIFNNQLTSIPESICDLNLDWNGISPANYPYFACGGNQLCDCDLIPSCVQNSDNINISMEQNYYSFLLDSPQDCSDSDVDCIMDCSDTGDVNGDSDYNVLDVVLLANCVLSGTCLEIEFGCAADLNGDSNYNVLDVVLLANCVLSANCSN